MGLGQLITRETLQSQLDSISDIANINGVKVGQHSTEPYNFGLLRFTGGMGQSTTFGDKFPKYSTPIKTKAVQMKPDSSDFARWSCKSKSRGK